MKKSCRKPGTSYTLPCKCQGLCKMRAFRQKLEEKCTTTEVPELSLKYEEFCTGSTYEGEWRKGFGMHGHGVYTFAHGVVYEGEFKDGAMHGTGELRYKTPFGIAAVRGKWDNGKMIERTAIFDEVLDYDEKDWKYCKMPDRRFAVEYDEGLLPGGKSNHTAKQLTLEIPDGHCDTEDGFYNCQKKMIVYNDDATRLVRGPGRQEQKWIENNCRVAGNYFNVGPREDLYENYVQPTQYLEAPPTPLVNTRFKLKSGSSETFESPLENTMEKITEHHGKNNRTPSKK